MIIINCLLEHFIKVLSLCLSRREKERIPSEGERRSEVMRISCCVDLLSVCVNVYLSKTLKVPFYRDIQMFLLKFLLVLKVS